MANAKIYELGIHEIEMVTGGQRGRAPAPVSDQPVKPGMIYPVADPDSELRSVPFSRPYLPFLTNTQYVSRI